MLSPMLPISITELIFVMTSGRNGDTIRSLTRQSKAKIVIEKPERTNEAVPVVISLTGTAEAIDTAKVKTVLWSCLAFCQQSMSQSMTLCMLYVCIIRAEKLCIRADLFSVIQRAHAVHGVCTVGLLN